MLATINPSMPKLYFYLSLIVIISCTQTEEFDFHNDKHFGNEFAHGLNEGDSIPLQDAIDAFDSQFSGDDLSSDSAITALKNRLDSLKAEIGFDPENEFLKTEIEDIEASFRMIEIIEKYVTRRDSVLNSIVPGIDTLMPK